MIETKSKRIGSKSLKTFITLIALNTWSSLDNIQKLWENQSSQSNKFYSCLSRNYKENII